MEASPARAIRRRAAAAELEYVVTSLCAREHVGLAIETLVALADPYRVRIIELLPSGPRAVKHVGDRLRLKAGDEVGARFGGVVWKR